MSPKLSPRPAIIETARDLLDRDLWVVPTNGKGPIWRAWQSERRTREELEQTLAGNKNLGIAIVLNQSPLIDVEYDKPEGEAALQEMFGGEIPPTPTWQSARGKHRLFRRPDGIAEKCEIVLDGIEFRIGNGKGACAIVPPSKHHETGKPRYWLKGLSLNDVEPAELPANIVERLKAPPAPEPTAEDGEKVKEGKRNNTLFGNACQLKKMGLDEAGIATALLALNVRLCDPPLPVSEVRAIAKSAASGEGVGTGFVENLIREIDLWHDESDDPYATLPQGEHKENWKIDKRSRPFRRWVSKQHYDATGLTLSSGELGDICAMIEGKAVFDGASHFLFRRCGKHDETFYLDLCDPEWRCVEIDAEGWRVVSDPPVKFRRAKAMHALPIPVETPGTELKNLLFPFLNMCEEQWPLLVAWLVAALRPMGPYPILKLLGEQGSAKTTTARVVRSLIDPNAAPVRAEPRSTRDLVIAANNAWILCLDNLSVVKADLSDALCRLATGGGFATRTLYSDDDEQIFDAQRPAILTSIEEIGTRSDLLERCLIIELPSIPAEKRRAEKAFWAEFEKVKPKILGALLDGVSGAIRRLPDIERRTDTELPRLADFHCWAEAAEESFGFAPGVFAEAYAANRANATEIALTSNPFVSALLTHLQSNPDVEATASELLETLLWQGGENQRRMPGWPRAPRVVSAILKRVAPNLRQIGIVVEHGHRGSGNAKEKIWKITGPCDPATPTEDEGGSQKRTGRKLAKSFSRKGKE